MRFTEPGNIGNVALKNRIVMAPMISNLSNPDGCTNENHISYLEERAKGGTGLIITEYTYIDSINARGSRNQAGVYNTDFIPKFRRLTERIHNHDAGIFMQLVHAGGKAFLDTNRQGPMAPSSVDYAGYTPREMTSDDIERVVADYVSAAKFVRNSNFDGIELHGAHGYLIQEFISPGLNHRTDKYGGSFEGRMKFPQEIIDAIRESVDLTMGIRLSLYEDEQGGYGPDYGLKAAEHLSGIDYVHFSAGRLAPPGSSPSFYGNKTHIADRLPRKAKITTMVVGSVTDAQDAEKVMKKSDFVSVGRGMLADPFFATKIIQDSPFLRPCIRCNQACRDLSFGEVRCTVNPDTGLETLHRHMDTIHGDLTVVGAGVMGLEASILAAKRGMKVTLYDQRESIGGQLLEITDSYKKTEFQSLLKYYSEVLRKLGIEARLNEKYSGKGLYCLPGVIYPSLPQKDTILVDSTIYLHHDEALQMSGRHRIIMTSRSLSSLDRVRLESYRKLATKAGIEFTDDLSLKFDVRIIERHQYDIRSAMVAGRAKFMDYVRENSSEYL